LLRRSDVSARLLRQRGDAGVYGVVARGELVEFLVLQRCELCDGGHRLPCRLLCCAIVRLRVRSRLRCWGWLLRHGLLRRSWRRLRGLLLWSVLLRHWILCNLRCGR